LVIIGDFHYLLSADPKYTPDRHGKARRGTHKGRCRKQTCSHLEAFSVQSKKWGKKGQESHSRESFLKNAFPNHPLLIHIKYSVNHVALVAMVTFEPYMLNCLAMGCLPKFCDLLAVVED
jgi:hypothetical protein